MQNNTYTDQNITISQPAAQDYYVKLRNFERIAFFNMSTLDFHKKLNSFMSDLCFHDDEIEWILTADECRAGSVTGEYPPAPSTIKNHNYYKGDNS